MGKVYPPYHRESRRRFKQFPQQRRKTVAEKQAESVPLERAERRALQLDSLCRTADRMLTHDLPVNSAVSLRYRASPPKSARSVFVYLLRFSSKVSDEPDFLKIGITNNMTERFDLDCYRYNVSQIKTIGGLTRSEALATESGLHAMFCDKAYLPKLKLLSKGNTECFVNDEAIVNTVVQVFSLLEKEKAGLVQR